MRTPSPRLSDPTLEPLESRQLLSAVAAAPALAPAPSAGARSDFPAGPGLVAEYFGDANLRSPLMRRVDPAIDFHWNEHDDDPISLRHTFSTRWTGQVAAARSTRYTFLTKTDDGARLWVNGKLLVDDWTHHPAKVNRGTISLHAGQVYDLKFEYYENGVGDASAQMLWSVGYHGTVAVVPARALSHDGASEVTDLASRAAGRAIRLTWHGTSAGGYVVERSTRPGRGFARVGATAAGVTAYSDTTAARGVVYYYRVVPVARSGDRGAAAATPSNTASGILPPAAPDAPSPAPASDHSIDVTWRRVAGATGYTLQRSPDGTHFGDVTHTAGDVTEYRDAGLQPGARYVYRLIASNDAGDSAPSAPAAATLSLHGPATLAAHAVSASEIDLSWAPVAGAAGYSVSRSPDGVSGWAPDGTTAAPTLTLADVGLPAGSTRYYRIVATGAAGDSAPSPTASDTTVPPTPTNVAAAGAGAAAAAVTWDATPGATGYVLERSADGTTFTTVATPATNHSSDGGLSRGATYLYRVSASNAAGTSDPSAPAGATTAPAAPASLAATPVSTAQIHLAWPAAAAAAGYDLERSADDITFVPVTSVGANTLSYDDTGLDAGTLYYYQLEATNPAGRSPAVSDRATTLPAAPTTLAAHAVSASRINLTWDDVAGETGFTVERSADGATGWALAGTTGAGVTAFGNTGLSAGALYYYRVTASGAAGASAASNVASDTTVPPAPLNVTRSTGATTAALAWDASPGATLYKVQRSADGAQFTPIGTSATTHFDDSGLSTGTPYQYRVIASNAAGDSGPSAAVTATTLPAAPAGVTAAPFSATRVDVSWTASAGATLYKVLRSTDGVTFVTRGTSGLPSFSDTAASPGTQYQYQVVATGAAGDSAPGGPAQATTPAVAPTNAAATAASASRIDVTWNAAAGATGYVVERSGDGVNNWSQAGTTGAGVTTFGNTGLSAGTPYYYRVVAVDPSVNSGASNVAGAATLPAAPAGAAAAAVADTQVNVTWNDVTGETGYVIERSPDGAAGWARAGAVGAGTTTFYNAGLTANTTYYYRVRAVNASGQSLASATVNATTAAAVPDYAAQNVVYGLSTANDVYSIDTTTGTATMIGTMAFSTVAGARDPIGGKFYYVETNTSTPRVATWDPATNTNTTLNTVTLSAPVLRAGFRRDGTLFVTAGNGDLYTIDRATGAATALGTITVGGAALPSNSGDLAFSPDGTLYVASNGTLYSVDTQTLHATLLGSSGVGSTQIAFGDQGILYASASNNLYRVNLTTGAATLVGGSGVGFGDLASVPRYADLGVSQSASPLVKGSTGAYTLAVNSAGPDAPAGALTVTDLLPAGLTFVSAAGDGWGATVSGQTVTLTYGGPVTANATLPPVTITVAVGNSAPASVINTVTVSSRLFDPAAGNNQSVLTSAVS